MRRISSRYAREHRRNDMEPSPAPWISALRHSHDALQGVVEPLNVDQLEQRSYASEWSIAQVLSHLGSQSEIFGLFLRVDAVLVGPGVQCLGRELPLHAWVPTRASRQRVVP